jgi:uncharacterized protein YfaS (alpha-2-macroglobulin family)
MANNSYTKQWQKVDSLQNLGQLQSALDAVMTIYSQSKTDGHPDQTIRALLYKIRIEADFQENSYEKAIDFAQNELVDAKTPVKQVLYSILAQLHWSYYQNNSWKINQRTPVAGNRSPDINTWDTRRFVEVSTNYYLLSVSEADALKNIPLGQFESILEEKKSTRNLRPTLFDFLVFRAIEFFSDERAAVTIPSNVFRMNDERYFSPIDEFVGIEILTEDTLSFEYQALKLYQKVLQFHQTKTDVLPMVDADLARLKYIHRKSIIPSKDELYIDALRSMLLNYRDQPVSAEISYELASMLRTQGNKYNPLVSEAYKWQLKEALEIAESAVERFPDSDGANNCKVLINQIKSPALNVTANNAVTPRLPSLALVGYRNIDSLYLRIVSLDYEADQKRLHQNQKDQIEKYLTLKVCTNWSLELPTDNDYQTHSTEIKLPPLPSGYYILLASSTPDFNLQSEVTFMPFWSTNISVIGRLTNDGYEFHILGRKSGQPIPKLKIQLVRRNYDYRVGGIKDSTVQHLVTDKNGFGIIPRGMTSENSQIYLKISTPKDNFVTEAIWMGYPYETEAKKEIRTHFFTDRAIYRPGQTMYYKGIVLEKDGDKSSIKTKFPSTAIFTDVNGQEISKQELVTNEFGSFSGSFVVPQAVLTGSMQISDKYGSVGFQVEEYKRPRFEVTFPPIEGSYKLGEEIEVTGKAMSYAGSTLSDANVSYRVVRNARFPIIWWGWRDRFPSSPEMEIANGTSVTDNNGQFRITFKAIADPDISKELSPIFTYTVFVGVTDINGETQRAETSVSVGYAAMVITTNVEDHVNADVGIKLEIKTTNLNGQPEAAAGSITINRIIQPKQVLYSRKWARPDKFTMTRDEFNKYFPGEVYNNEDDITQWERGETIFSERFVTPDSSVFSVMKTIAPGLYLIEITSTDSFGEVVNYTKYFRAYSPSGKKTAETAPFTATLLTPEAEPGQTASILVASPLKNAFLVVDILSKNTNATSRYYRLNNSQFRIDIPVFEENRGNIALNFVLVSNNRIFQESRIITVPYTNKKLDIEISSFRSNLEPGQEEEWQITIKDKQGEKAVAELLTGMYDASLDAFISHQWPFPIYNDFLQVPAWSGDNGFSVIGGRNHWYRRDWGRIIEKEYERMIWIGGYDYGWGGLRRMSMVSEQDDIMIRGNAEVLSVTAQEMDIPPRKTVEKIAEDAQFMIESDEQVMDKLAASMPLPVKPRTDFNETAFFFPHLVTNEQGETALKFRIPESLTRWNLMGLAHTKDLKTGTIAKSLVTRKDLMVFPNAPRFLREGDRMQFSAKISNVSDEQLEGEATLRFFDAFTMQPIDEKMGLINPDKAFTVEKGLSVQVGWEIRVPEGLQAVVYRITATAGNFSDGEEAPLPVLTNRMLVTESLPLPVRANTSRSFTFDKLLNSGQTGSTLKNHSLTLEFTSNPAWYAVQALPYLMEFPYDCSEQIFSRFYANSLASHIANSDPQIRRVFDLWRTIAPDALRSNLEKNEQLKSVLLEESPWVREAKSESERKQRIALLFDLNRMAIEKKNALLKLQELQTINGGWPWFTGMRESVYITRHIVTGLGRMIRMGAISPEDDELNEIVRKAISFLDKEMLKSFERLKKDNPEFKKNDHLGYSDIQYFYARTYFLDDYPFDSSLSELVEYYKAQAMQYWSKNNQYMKAMTALFLNRMGEKSTAALIMRSLTETALRNDEMGMYWRNQPKGWYWYEAPVETHSLIIEAYDEMLNDTKTVDELKVWLLKQKQVQDWKTTRATTEAIYALLMRGSSLLASDKPVSIHVGNSLVKQEVGDGTSPEPGTGYFRSNWSAGEISPQMGKIEVTNPNPTVAWGAMYWQYFEQLDKITPAQTPLKLQKELFVEVNSPSGPVLQPITSYKPIKVGDRVVVRVILTTDRDMEYIHLKDMRASAFEPVNVLSGYRWQGGLGFYESTRDAATNFFIDYLPKGTYVFEYKLNATQRGDFSNGITTVQSMYAPEFSAHSEGIRIKVE